MRNLILFLGVLFLTLACTKTEVCDTGKAAAKLVSAQIAVQLDCKNVEAIQTDVEASLVKLKICEPPPAQIGATAMGPIGDVVCKPIIDALVAGLVTQIPEKYGCSGGKITDDVKLKLVVACSKAF